MTLYYPGSGYNDKSMAGREIDWGSPLSRGLVHASLISDGLGSVWDLVGRTKGTFQGSGTSTTTGPFGQTLLFNGSGCVTFTSTVFGNAMAGAFSLACWINITSGTGAHYVNRYASPISTSNDIALRLNPSQHASCDYVDAAVATHTKVGVATISFGKWYHVVAVNDPSSVNNFKTYVNGLPDGSPTSATSTLLVSTNTFSIGGGWSGSAVSSGAIGSVDLPMVWNRALTDAEVGLLYAQPLALFAPTALRRYSVLTPNLFPAGYNFPGFQLANAVYRM